MSRRLVAAAALMLLLGVAIGLPLTGATFTDTSDYDGTVTAAEDWTPPTVTVTPLPSYVGGTTTVSAEASDARTSVTEVTFELAVAGDTTWSTICVDTTAPYSCSWNTTTVADGRYQLQATATDAVDLSSTSTPIETRVVNSASVILTAPGELVRGSVPLSAAFVNAGGALATMRIEYVVAGGSNWATIPGCGNVTNTTARSCTWMTSGAGTYDLRAVAVAGATYYDYAYGVSVDNVIPTVALTVPTGTLAGTIVLAASADDADSGVATVSFQYRQIGDATWQICGISSAAPYRCSLDTTTIANGSYEFRAIATDNATNATTTTSQTRTIDNTIASVSITNPVAGAVVSGTVPVSADAYSNQGVTSVRIEVRPSGGVWAALCTDTGAPYSCAWSTATNGEHELRAVLTQGNGATVVSNVVAVTVDNSPLRARDVQAISSGTAGRPSAGDRLVLTYSALVDPATIKAGWTGAATAINVDFKDKKMSGGLVAGYDRAEFPGTNLGQVRFGQNYVVNGLMATFPGSTMVASTASVGGVQVTVVTITLGTTTQSANLHTTSAGALMGWTPSAQVKTPAGAACSTTAISETGATDRDL